jgi:hypothetical protein
MPSSTSALYASSIVSDLDPLDPHSILDVGCGFGLWGFLCRFCLDVHKGRHFKDSWTTRIEAVEVHEPYIMPHQKFLYDRIHIGLVEDLIDSLGEFDLYIFGDVLEHLPKEAGQRVFRTAYNMARKGVVVNIPLGDQWLRDGRDENPYEAHVSTWDIVDFLEFWPKLYGEIVFSDVGRYTALLIDKTADNEKRASYMLENGRKYIDKDTMIAEQCFRRTIEIGALGPDPRLELVNCLLNRGETEEAVAILKNCVDLYPDRVDVLDMLYKLLRKLNRIEEAREVQARRAK